VGHLAVQFAKAKGGVVLTTASGSDLDFVRELGADEVIDYKAERFEDRMSDVDLVFDLVAGDTQDRSWGVLKEGGILVSTLGQPPAEKAAQHNVQAAGYRAQPNPAQMREIGRLIDDGQVRVVVDRVFPLTEAAAAQDYLEQEHVRGKVVLRVSDET
jgi:NADPH:quinone reductase-like Zn-dependent oxidoreductase